MRRGWLLAVGVGAVLATSPSVWADWNVGDPFKMHYPQLPNPNGWDVNMTYPNNLADDFRCTETGFINDVHFWGSWKNDIVGQIQAVRLSIHADIPAQPPTATNPNGTPSRPGPQLWNTVVPAPLLVVRPWGTGPQGWLDCTPPPTVLPQNHFQTWQVNIPHIPNPCFQEAGTIYWLDLTVLVAPVTGGLQPEFGWKSSLQHFNDDAVWGRLPDGLDGPAPLDWIELYEPLITPPLSMDMSFVITPAPGSGAILAVAGLMIARRRR